MAPKCVQIFDYVDAKEHNYDLSNRLKIFTQNSQSEIDSYNHDVPIRREDPSIVWIP